MTILATGASGLIDGEVTAAPLARSRPGIASSPAVQALSAA